MSRSMVLRCEAIQRLASLEVLGGPGALELVMVPVNFCLNQPDCTAFPQSAFRYSGRAAVQNSIQSCPAVQSPKRGAQGAVRVKGSTALG
jgi:hypothetical protein